MLLIKFTLINLFLQHNERVIPVKITGKVCSNIVREDGEYRLGIYFDQIDQEAKAAINNFIRMAEKIP